MAQAASCRLAQRLRGRGLLPKGANHEQHSNMRVSCCIYADVLAEEQAHEAIFQPLPFHYIEVAQLLLRHAKGAFEESSDVLYQVSLMCAHVMCAHVMCAHVRCAFCSYLVCTP